MSSKPGHFKWGSKTFRRAGWRSSHAAAGGAPETHLCASAPASQSSAASAQASCASAGAGAAALRRCRVVWGRDAPARPARRRRTGSWGGCRRAAAPASWRRGAAAGRVPAARRSARPPAPRWGSAAPGPPCSVTTRDGPGAGRQEALQGGRTTVTVEAPGRLCSLCDRKRSQGDCAASATGGAPGRQCGKGLDAPHHNVIVCGLGLGGLMQ